jgi:hypothetical protein
MLETFNKYTVQRPLGQSVDGRSWSLQILPQELDYTGRDDGHHPHRHLARHRVDPTVVT